MKNNKNIVGMPCIWGSDGILKVSLEAKIEVWKEYEEKLQNEKKCKEWRIEC